MHERVHGCIHVLMYTCAHQRMNTCAYERMNACTHAHLDGWSRHRCRMFFVFVLEESHAGTLRMVQADVPKHTAPRQRQCREIALRSMTLYSLHEAQAERSQRHAQMCRRTSPRADAGQHQLRRCTFQNMALLLMYGAHAGLLGMT